MAYLGSIKPTSTKTTTSVKSGGYLGSKVVTSAKTKLDTKTISGLQSIAQQNNIKVPDTKPKESLFTKVMDILSRGNYMSANIAKEITDNKPSSAGDVLNAAWRGIKGQDKTTYSQVLQDNGVGEMGALQLGPIRLTGRGALGLVGDVLLDPTTYVGAGLIGKVSKGAKAIPVLGKGVQLAEDVAKGMTTPVRDALGKLFVPFYGTSVGAGEDISKFVRRTNTNTAGIYTAAKKRYEELAGKVGHKEVAKIGNAAEEARLLEQADREMIQNTATTALKQKRSLTIKEIRQLSNLKRDEFEKLLIDRRSQIKSAYNTEIKNLESTASSLEKSLSQKERAGLLATRKDKSTILKEIDTQLNGMYDISKSRKLTNVTLGNFEQLKEGQILFKKNSGIFTVGKKTNNAIELIDSLGNRVTASMDDLKGFKRVDILEEKAGKLLRKKDYYKIPAYSELSSELKEINKKLSNISNKENPIYKNLIKEAKQIKTKMQKETTDLAIRRGSKELADLRNVIEETRYKMKKAISSKVARQTVTQAKEAGFRTGTAEAYIRKVAKKYGLSEDTIQFMINESGSYQKYAKKLNIQDPYAAYYPFITENKSVQGIKKSGIGMSGQGYIKEFTGKGDRESLIHNSALANAMRTSQVVNDITTKDFLTNFVNKYGKQFADEGEARAAGYLPIKTKGMFGEILGYAKENDANYIKNIFDPGFKDIDKLAQSPIFFGKSFDQLNQMWKSALTKYFPSFHIRNMISGIIQNYEVIGKDAISPQTHATANEIMRLLDGGVKGNPLIKIGNKIYKKEYLVKLYKDKFGRGDWKNIADLADSLAIDKLGSMPVNSKLSQLDIIGKGGEKVASWTETEQKMVAFISSLKQGETPKKALELAELAGFDYSKVTPFEAKVMRRIIPFYTFTRKNLELQGRTLINHPERISNINKVFSNLSGPQAKGEQSGLAPYQQEQFNIRTGQYDAQGRPIYVSPGGLAPETALQQFSGNPFMRLVSQTNPMFKYIFEKSTGIDTFRSSNGEVRYTKDNTNADKYASAPQPLKDFLEMKPVTRTIYANGKKVGTKTGYNANPDRLMILGALPTSRFTSTFANMFNPDESITDRVKQVAIGLNSFVSDKEQQQYFKDKSDKEALTKLLEDAGILSSYEITYKK